MLVYVQLVAGIDQREVLGKVAGLQPVWKIFTGIAGKIGPDRSQFVGSSLGGVAG